MQGFRQRHRARASGGRLGATPYFRSWQCRSEKAARDEFAGVDRFWNGSVIEFKGLPLTQVSLRDRMGKKGKEDVLRTCSIYPKESLLLPRRIDDLHFVESLQCFFFLFRQVIEWESLLIKWGLIPTKTNVVETIFYSWYCICAIMIYPICSSLPTTSHDIFGKGQGLELKMTPLYGPKKATWNQVGLLSNIWPAHSYWYTGPISFDDIIVQHIPCSTRTTFHASRETRGRESLGAMKYFFGWSYRTEPLTDLS